MTSLGRAEKLARLAMINLPASELAVYEEGLNTILGFVEKLDALKLGPIPDGAQEGNVFRDDVVKPSLTQGEALRNAPKQENGFFVIPKVVE